MGNWRNAMQTQIIAELLTISFKLTNRQRMCALESLSRLPLHCSNINGRVKRLFHDLRQMFTLFVRKTGSLRVHRSLTILKGFPPLSFGRRNRKPRLVYGTSFTLSSLNSRSSRGSQSERHSSIFLFSFFCQSWLKHRRRPRRER